MFPPGQVGDDSPDTQFDLEVIDRPSEREYRVTVTVPPSQESAAPTATPDPAMDPETARMAEEMAKMMMEMIKVTWTINVPGQVVETNADLATETGGTWEFGMDRIQQGRELKLISRERKG